MSKRQFGVPVFQLLNNLMRIKTACTSPVLEHAFFSDIKKCKYFSMTTGQALNWSWSLFALVVMRLSRAFTLTSSTLSKFRSALFLLSSRISIFSSSTSACCSSSSQTSSSSSWKHSTLSERVSSLCECVCLCVGVCAQTIRQTLWGSKRHLVGSCCFMTWHAVRTEQSAHVAAYVFTWISGLVTRSTMLLASSLDSKATAFSLSCTSLPLICKPKTQKYWWPFPWTNL